MKASLRELDLDLKNFKPHCEEDRFGKLMTEFNEKAQSEYSLLEGMHKKMESLYLEMGVYLSFEPKQYTMDECFGDIKLFKDQYMQAVAENVARREMEEKARRAKEQKEKLEKEKKERASNKIVLNKEGPDQNDQGLMEHLLNSLHSGTAFAPRRKRTKAVTPQGKWSVLSVSLSLIFSSLSQLDRRQQLSRSRSRSSLDQTRGGVMSTTPGTPTTPSGPLPPGTPTGAGGGGNVRRNDLF